MVYRRVKKRPRWRERGGNRKDGEAERQGEESRGKEAKDGDK